MIRSKKNRVMRSAFASSIALVMALGSFTACSDDGDTTVLSPKPDSGRDASQSQPDTGATRDGASNANDATADHSVDSASDSAADVSVDASRDASADAMADASADATTDATTDAMAADDAADGASADADAGLVLCTRNIPNQPPAPLSPNNSAGTAQRHVRKLINASDDPDPTYGDCRVQGFIQPLVDMDPTGLTGVAPYTDYVAAWLRQLFECADSTFDGGATAYALVPQSEAANVSSADFDALLQDWTANLAGTPIYTAAQRARLVEKVEALRATAVTSSAPGLTHSMCPDGGAPDGGGD